MPDVAVDPAHDQHVDAHWQGRVDRELVKVALLEDDEARERLARLVASVELLNESPRYHALTRFLRVSDDEAQALGAEWRTRQAERDARAQAERLASVPPLAETLGMPEIPVEVVGRRGDRPVVIEDGQLTLRTWRGFTIAGMPVAPGDVVNAAEWRIRPDKLSSLLNAGWIQPPIGRGQALMEAVTHVRAVPASGDVGAAAPVPSPADETPENRKRRLDRDRKRAERAREREARA